MNRKDSVIKNKIYSILFMIVGVFLLLAILELLHHFSRNPVIFPSISEIFQSFFKLMSSKELYISLGYSFLRTLLAILLSFAFAIIFGTFSALYSPIEKILKPIVSIFKCIPIPCFVFIIFAYLPFNKLLGLVIIVFMIVFPIMYESINSGIKNINPSIYDSLKLEGLYHKNSIFKVILPMATPYVILAFLTSFGLAIKVEITAEIILNSNNLIGLGNILYLAYSENEFTYIYAIIIVILIMFTILDTLIYLIKHKILKNF